jgi:hypothetical protein
MNAIATPFKQLVERRLWPLAVLLLAAIVAVPTLLAREPDVLPPATSAVQPAEAVAQAALATQPIVTVGDGSERESKRKVLGARKDPFEPEIKAAKEPAATAAAEKPAASAGEKTPAAVGGGGASTPQPVIVTPAAPVTPKKIYETWSLTVRFGDTTGGELEKRNVKRLKALPSAETPAVIYLGVLDNHKTAVFLVDHDATVQGDGKCFPAPDDCQTMHMRAGDIAFIDVHGADGTLTSQYQLELVKVRRNTSTDASALNAEAKGGRAALRARVGRVGRLRYDAKKGTLQRLSAKAYSANMAVAASD